MPVKKYFNVGLPIVGFVYHEGIEADTVKEAIAIAHKLQDEFDSKHKDSGSAETYAAQDFVWTKIDLDYRENCDGYHIEEVLWDPEE